MIMTYDELISALTTLNERQGIARIAAPHCSNLLHQLYKRNPDKEGFYNSIVAEYLKTRQIDFTPDDINGYIDRYVQAINDYMDVYWPPQRNPFKHQADFTSSIIPEMLCIMLKNIVKMSANDLEVSAQKDLAIECIFAVAGGGLIHLKNKRVDVAVFKQCLISFNGKNVDLPIPLLAIECKTNLDKNMLSGIEQSVGDLKKTFPDCYYYVVTEFSDVNVRTNYASSGIDEMYILRQQKRIEIRRNPGARKHINPKLLYEIIEGLNKNIQLLNADPKDLSFRMENGKLIGRNI